MSLVFCLRLNKFIILICRIKSFNFELRTSFLCSLCKSKHSFWNDSCSVINSCDLSSEIVFFFSKEERICDNVSFKISSEKNFDHSTGSYISRHEVWEGFPLRQRVICDIVSELIDASSSWLKRRPFILFRVIRILLSFCCSLSDIIVFFSSIYFTPESKICRSSFKSESLKTLLKSISLLLAKAHSSPFKYSCL